VRNFGLKVGKVNAVKFEARIRELIEGMPELAEVIEPLLDARSKLRQHFDALHRKVPIPTKPPLCSDMIAPPDSEMISPPGARACWL
jgi:hypothetical protein